MTTATPRPFRPTILSATTTADIQAQVAAALATGRAARPGRWLARPTEDGFEVCAGDDTPACRAGGEPPTGWWTEHDYAEPQGAADDLVAFWLQDN